MSKEKNNVAVDDTNFLYELRDNCERRKDNKKFKHKQEKQSGFDTLCLKDPSCPENCNVCCMLPYHTKTGKRFLTLKPTLKKCLGMLMVHHYDAENAIWNEDKR